jgi:hypothetical protein
MMAATSEEPERGISPWREPLYSCGKIDIRPLWGTLDMNLDAPKERAEA